jgi:quercetin dioxygenase-like cupin family protein
MEVIRAQGCPARLGDRFSGTAWVEALVTARRPAGMRVYLVFFEPGARTHWHAHEGEHVLYVVSGSGRVQTAREPGKAIGPGDLVYVAPGEKHWHGAAPHSPMVHLAVTTGGQTSWMEEVSREEYGSD